MWGVCLSGRRCAASIDPATTRITGCVPTGAIETHILIPADGYLWICQCIDHEVLRFDPRTEGTHATGVAVDPLTGTVWVDDSRIPPSA
jgi:DNA-binding beta-propeller fold protein YncE